MRAKTRSRTRMMAGVGVGLGAVAIARRMGLGRWFVDSTARCPTGWLGRSLYGNAWAHEHAFQLLVDRLIPQHDETFLDVCCGGGGLATRLLDVCQTGAALDHSGDMVALAQENNALAVAEGRFDVRRGDASALPWEDTSFDLATCANAFFFLTKPEATLGEIWRVLRPGGRFCLVTTARTRLAQGLLVPWRRAMQLYTDRELTDMLSQVGFVDVDVVTYDGFYQLGYGVKPRELPISL